MSAGQLVEFKAIIRTRNPGPRRPDRQARKLLLYLFTGTRGGFTRLRIIMLLLDRPYNTHQLAQRIGMDYKAVQHHMQVLGKNNLISKSGDRYGAVFYLSNFLEININALEEVIEKLEKSMSYKKVYI